MRPVVSGRMASGIVALFLVALGLFIPHGAAAQESPPIPFPRGDRARYYPTTGHYVEGPFVDFYDQHGGLRILGYPQTAVYYDEGIGLWVQYFDNVRVEYHPENSDPYMVQLGLLGKLLGHSTPPIAADQIPHDSADRRYFPSTGHVVSGAFLTFFDQNGGLDVFGQPIAEISRENGLVVQYFERGRMEWHPERPSSQQVIMGSLGLAAMFRFRVPDQVRDYASPPQIAPDLVEQAEPLSLRARVSVHQAVVAANGRQTVCVYVTDAFRSPVLGAEVAIRIRYPEGVAEMPIGRTNERGIVSAAFLNTTVGDGRKVILEATVQAAGQSETVQTFYTSWE